MTPTELSRKHGISRGTARLAKERGHFFILDSNRDRVKNPPVAAVKILPLEIHEIGGKKLTEYKPKELAELLGYSLKVARTLRKKGVIKTLTLHAEKRADLASRLEKLNKEGQQPSQNPLKEAENG